MEEHRKVMKISKSEDWNGTAELGRADSSQSSLDELGSLSLGP